MSREISQFSLNCRDRIKDKCHVPLLQSPLSHVSRHHHQRGALTFDSKPLMKSYHLRQLEKRPNACSENKSRFGELLIVIAVLLTFFHLTRLWSLLYAHLSDEGDSSSTSTDDEGKDRLSDLEGPCCQPLKVPPSSPVNEEKIKKKKVSHASTFSNNSLMIPWRFPGDSLLPSLIPRNAILLDRPPVWLMIAVATTKMHIAPSEQTPQCLLLILNQCQQFVCSEDRNQTTSIALGRW